MLLSHHQSRVLFGQLCSIYMRFFIICQHISIFISIPCNMFSHYTHGTVKSETVNRIDTFSTCIHLTDLATTFCEDSPWYGGRVI